MVSKKKVSSKPRLRAEKRQIFGRQVKKLRAEGILPANIYGKKVKSTSIKLPLKEFLPIYEQAGETSLVELKVKGEKKARAVLVHNVQLDPVSDQFIHADFHQVDLKQKVTTEVPLDLVGESPAVEEKLGILIQPLTEVEVEALPTDLPDKFELDISGLKKVDDAVVVADLKVPKKVNVLTGSQQVLVKINPLAKEEEVAPPPAEEAPAEEAAGKARPEPAEEKPKEAKSAKPVETKPEEKEGE